MKTDARLRIGKRLRGITLKRKIGVCCEYEHRNYGSMLQALATVMQLEKLGYDYELIRYTRKLTPDLLARSLSRIPEEIGLLIRRHGQTQRIKKYPDIQEGIHLRNARFESFSRHYFLKVSRPYDTFFQLQQAARQYCAVLVGSDQLWTPRGYSTGFFNLLFVPDDIPKIAYATSFGVSQIPDSKKKIAKKFLSRIEFIGVRETRAAEMIKELTGRDVPTVADPTLLFSAQDWLNMIPLRNLPSLVGKKYIFCYFLGSNPQQRREAEKLRAETGYEIVFLPHLDEFIPGDLGFGDVQLFDVGPEEFVNLIRNAAYVCTDSFHDSVFSILYHKPFVTFNRFEDHDKNSRNSRIDTLLAQTELENRRFCGRLLEQINQPIDTVRVDKRLQELRVYSLSYLNDAVSRV